MKKIFLACILCASFGFYGCSSDNDSDPVSPETTADHGYYPLTQGSSWTYDAFLDGRPAQVIHQVNGDTTINFKKYTKRVLYTNGELRYSFMRRSNDTIYTHSFSEETPGDMILLIEKGTGTEWSTYYSDLGLESRTQNTIISKKDSYTVNGTIYKDVLQIRQIQTLTGWGQNSTIAIDVYFAKNTGLIESESNTEYARLSKYTVK